MAEAGMIDTNMARVMSEVGKARIAASIPLGRFGEPTEIASLVCFLAGQDTAYITGATLAIDDRISP